MRNINIVEGEYYHLYNRGVNKQKIFIDKRDWVRFLFCILYFQSPLVIYNLNRPVGNFVRHSVFNMDEVEIIANKYVELVAFCLMPNHFHLLVQEKEEGGISRYMQRVQNAYTKYSNTRYKKSGHLFQGPYQIVHIEDNEQLIYLSAYIHKNPGELKGFRNKEDVYTWSSYQDYTKENRFPSLLKPDVIIEQYESAKEYQRAVKESGAKDLDDLVRHSVSNN